MEREVFSLESLRTFAAKPFMGVGIGGPQMYKAAPCRVMSQLYHCLVTFHGTTTPLSAFVIVHKASSQRFSQEASEALSCDLNPHRDLN